MLLLPIIPPVGSSPTVPTDQVASHTVLPMQQTTLMPKMLPPIQACSTSLPIVSSTPDMPHIRNPSMTLMLVHNLEANHTPSQTGQVSSLVAT